jgi:hypothetical protein
MTRGAAAGSLFPCQTGGIVMLSNLTLKRHADLVDRMATAQGVDLEESMMAGHLTPGELGDAVLACTGCAAPEACEHWLAAHDAGESAPGYCRNTELLVDLAARLAR